MTGYNTTQSQKIASRAVIGALVLWLAFSGVAAAGQLYVNDSGWWRDGGAFNVSETQIQAAVGAADAGDSIYVHGGSYNENVDVDKARLTLEGAGADVVTVTAANSGDHVFEVADVNYVNISGFAVRGATDDGMIGIYLNNVDCCNISGNYVYGNCRGILLSYSSDNALTSNTANKNDYYGIWLDSSSDNTLTSNTANSNNDYGITLSSSSDNTLTHNNASNNDYGITLSSSSNNTLTNNTANFNNWGNGIRLYSSSDNTLTHNNASNNCGWGRGIVLSYSSDNNLTSNIASSNYCGIWLDSSSSNTLSDNTANSNNDCGIYLSYSSNNTLTNNTANKNDYYGIWLDSSSDNNNITCNLMRTNTKHGFYLSGGRTGNTISYNNIIENGNYNATSGGWEWQFCMGQYQPVEAKHNYWGAGMNNSTIDASIYDDEEGDWGEVEFYPFETEPVPCAPTPEEPYTFTTTDAVIALQIVAGSRPSDLYYDVSGDGSVTSLDALMILQVVMQAAAGNPEDPITGCGDIDQSILRMYDEDGDGRIDANWMVNAGIDLDEGRITQSEYDQVKYAYEHGCPVEPAE